MAKVNLDALIPREDFRIVDNKSATYSGMTGQTTFLESGQFFYASLRKPDFQRETSEWDHKMICDFIESFLNGDLIPAIILWNSGNYIFVIDGAHRLSALIAWVHDDYGDGEISKSFYEHLIPEDQIQAAEQTRRLINKTVGSYKAHKSAISGQITNPDPKILEQARRLGPLAWQNQWVQGDAEKAEDSFFKINQKAVVINPTELQLLKGRTKPNALAARAIIRSGTGHKYWSDFEEDKRREIEQIAQEIYHILFKPSFNTPIKTLDLPVAGGAYSSKALPIVFDLVNLVNSVDPDKIDVDKDGEETINFLKNTRKVVRRVSGLHPSSLGLHPIVYFYSHTGRFQPTSLLAIAALIQEFEARKLFRFFTQHRQRLEDFLLRHKDIQHQVAVKYGAGLNRRGYSHLQDLYLFLLDLLSHQKTEDEILEALQQKDEFSFLKLSGESDSTFTRGQNFSTETKSAAFLREALKSPLLCQICHGLIHYNSITADHIIRKQEGGAGVLNNAQLAHPYCNTTFKH